MSSLRRVLAVDGPEALVLLFALALRVRMAAVYDPQWGYDVESHLACVKFFADHGVLAPLHVFREAYQPPLFYWIAGTAMRHGASLGALRGIVTWATIARLALYAWGLRRLLPESRLARVVALAIAAVLPCALHIDSMLSNEGLTTLPSMAALIFGALALQRHGRARWWTSAWLAVALTLALLCKISPLSIVATIGLALGAEMLLAPGRAVERAARALPIGLALAASLAVALPVYARHRKESGHLISTGYDTTASEHELGERAQSVPYLSRRPLAFFVGLGRGDVFRRPWWPSDVQPESRFWPVLLASTFCDYYNYRFTGVPRPGEAWVLANRRPLVARAIPFMRASLLGGLALFFATLAALVGAARWLWRRRNLPRLFLLAAPMVALAGQLHFVTQYPVDFVGPIKGAYFQFVSAPLFGLFGVAVAWLWRRPRLRPIALLLLASLGAVAAYSFYAVA